MAAPYVRPALLWSLGTPDVTTSLLASLAQVMIVPLLHYRCDRGAMAAEAERLRCAVAGWGSTEVTGRPAAQLNAFSVVFPHSR